MSPVDQALQTLLGWFRAVFGAFLAIFGLIEHYLVEFLLQLGIPPRLQTGIIVLAALAFIVAVVRLFGGLFRILLIVFLALLVLRVLAPLLGV